MTRTSQPAISPARPSCARAAVRRARDSDAGLGRPPRAGSAAPSPPRRGGSAAPRTRTPPGPSVAPCGWGGAHKGQGWGRFSAGAPTPADGRTGGPHLTTSKGFVIAAAKESAIAATMHVCAAAWTTSDSLPKSARAAAALDDVRDGAEIGASSSSSSSSSSMNGGRSGARLNGAQLAPERHPLLPQRPQRLVERHLPSVRWGAQALLAAAHCAAARPAPPHHFPHGGVHTTRPGAGA